MTQLFNRFGEKQIRRALRNEMPRCEVILWSRLKGKQLNSIKFRRQYSVGRYILDFYAPVLKLGIELDGDSHFGDGAEERDRERQRFIEACGIHLLRFNNVDVMNNLEAVIDSILRTVIQISSASKDLSDSDLPQPLLVKEGLPDRLFAQEARS
jgi:very-short-patch-repair endonuclease